MAEDTENIDPTGDPQDADPAAPAHDPTPEPVEERLVTVSIGGQSFNVPEAAAAAYDFEKAARQEQLDDIRTVQESAPRPAAGETQEEPFDYETALFTDANATVKRIREETRDEVLAVVRTERATEKREAEFWDSIYEKNPELKGEDFIVKGVVAENMASLRGLPKDRVIDLIAEKSMDRILTIAQRHGAPTPSKDDVRLTGARPRSQAKTPEQKEEDNASTSLGDAIRKKRAGTLRSVAS
jgi:hypothetical protein